MPEETFPFNPDWTVAPAATLDDWMDENGVDLDDLANRIVHGRTDTGHYDAIKAQLRKVLAKDPVDGDTAIMLQLCTGIPVSFWVNHEANYRRDLAAGKTDTTHVMRHG
jgi:hypothetical protein